MLTQAFHFNILKKYTVTFMEQTDAFLNKVQAEVGKETNLISLITKITLDIICGNGCKIPAESVCIICVYDVHRLPNLYPETEKFIPERFLPENTVDRHPFAYIPFSAGPRNCIGQKFAMLEIKPLISGLIRRFHVDPVTKTTDIRYKSDLVLRSTHPLYVQFKNR
ncbi:unnamed protein product [Pieris brassicae]|uniref:Cytochrome P450 n=1 Tax=Pieris brassicae TaxID=7116 RepID=A0A9P0TSM8_PIEBR|nr:unnamed protein product [Pieris brassicae]